MSKRHRFRIDIKAQRRKLRGLEPKTSRAADLWSHVKRLARDNPRGNPWLLPFVALIDEQPADIINARAAIENYLAEAGRKGDRGYLFNIWCFAFPHCRWAMWFDMLRAAGHYSQEEADAIAARFLLIQFRDHNAGMLIKPFPECVDNQAAALVLSSYVVGSIFAADGPGDGNLARKLRDEAAPRLEAMIGGMPASGYSGEGSTYQGLVVAFAVPFLTEALEDLRDEDLFESPLRPNGTSPRKILEMTRRLWMPGGLLLPWDDYGYQFGITFPLAYLAHRTGDPQSLWLLEHAANYSRMTITSSGWGYDQPIWTLVYWPDAGGGQKETVWAPWAEDELGAVLVDPAGENYLMQMWDPAGSMCARSHVNPNSLVLARKGIPFTADGAAAAHCAALQYDGAVFERSFGAGARQRLNLSRGCGGSHNVILVDGYEGLRPPQGESQGRLVSFDAEARNVTADVTNLYASVYKDCRVMRRRSRLIENRFWLVEDLAEFAQPHTFSSRWWFRPDARPVSGGVDVETPEGALLQMRCVLGSNEGCVTRVEGFPVEPDGCSDRVDFEQSGTHARWLYVLWPTDTVEVVRELCAGWAAFPVDRIDAAPGPAPAQTRPVHPGGPPWFQQEIAVSKNWAYRTKIDVTGPEPVLLRLPRGVDNSARLWLNGTGHVLDHPSTDKLVPRLIDCTPYLNGSDKLVLTIAMTFATGQDEKGHAVSFPDQPVALCTRIAVPDLLAACNFENGILTVESTAGQRFKIEQPLMEN